MEHQPSAIDQATLHATVTAKTTTTTTPAPHAPQRPFDQTRLEVSTFLRHMTCYKLLPVNSKLIVLDTTLQIKKAYYALLQNGIRSAPLWDNTKRAFVGMLTATDFMNLILYYYDKCSYQQAMGEINQMAIRSLRGDAPESFIHMHPMGSIYEAAKTLLEAKIHRLPLVDHDTALGEGGAQENDDGRGQQSVVSVMTAYRILNFIAVNFKNKNLFRFSLEELGLGRYDNLATATPDTPVIDILRDFIDYEISAVPIVDEHGVILDAYEKYDLLVLASYDGQINLDSPVKEALLSRSEIFEGVHTCRRTDTIASILAAIRKTFVHRFMIVDEQNKLEGVMSLSDILRALVM